MECFIWQQFSSNHSGSFTVVGKFTTDEEAAQAAEVLDQTLRQAAQWLFAQIDQMEETDGRALSKWATISPAEKELKEHYGINDDEPLYFIIASPTPTSWEQLLFVDALETYGDQNPQGYYELIKRMGGEAVIDWDMIDGWYMTKVRTVFSCTLPDASTAVDIEQELQKYGTDCMLEDDATYTIDNIDNVLYYDALVHTLEVNKETLHLTFAAHLSRMPKQIANIVNYLRQKQCTDIVYTVEEYHGYDDEDW